MHLFFQSAVQQKPFKSGIQAGNGKSVEKTILLRLQSDESVRETGMGGGGGHRGRWCWVGVRKKPENP